MIVESAVTAVVNSYHELRFLVLGDSNSQWQKKSSKKCQLGEVPVEGQEPVGGQSLTLGRTFFSNFVGGKNLTHFQP